MQATKSIINDAILWFLLFGEAIGSVVRRITAFLYLSTTNFTLYVKRTLLYLTGFVVHISNVYTNIKTTFTRIVLNISSGKNCEN